MFLPAAAEAPPPAPAPPGHILVVEDDPIVRDALASSSVPISSMTITSGM